MDLPDELLIGQLKTQHAYHDKKSQEGIYSSIIKPKNKLLGYFLAYTYPFFVLTTDKDACHQHLTVEILQTDWEQKDEEALAGEVGYVDITKVETHSEEEILKKMRDKSNGFRQVGRLSDIKFREIKGLKEKIKTSRKNISPKTKEVIYSALDEVNADITKRLNL